MLAEAVHCYQLAATLEPQKHEWAASYAAASEELTMQRWLPRRAHPASPKMDWRTFDAWICWKRAILRMRWSWRDCCAPPATPLVRAK